MLETDIIKGYENGDFKGIVYDGDYAYVPLRLTGTGKVERLDDLGMARIVDRKLELFSTKELMERYANLPVVLNHPTNENGEFIRASVDTPEYFVGNTIYSYLAGSEIWTIARLHNKEVVAYIANNDVSTSPHFITKEIKNDDYFVEIPDKINSLAIVANGFWDKKSIVPPVDNSEFNIIDDKGVGLMDKEIKTDEMKEKADGIMVGETSKADAEGTQEPKAEAENKETDKKEKADEDKEVQEKEQNKTQEKADVLPNEAGTDAGLKDKVQELLNNEAQEAQGFQELANQHAKFEKDKADNDLVQGDWNEQDELRDELIGIITDVVDNAPKEILAKKIYVGERLAPHAVIKRFVSANKKLVDSKYQGIINKIDSADMVDIGRDIIENIKKNINLKAQELNKPVDTNERVTIHRDGTKSFKLI